jgi:hypothetical protein
MRIVILALALAAATAGCVPSHPVAEGEFDRYWLLTDMSSGVRAAPPRAGEGFRIPSMWIIHVEDDETVASDSLRRAAAELRQGADEMELSISSSHTAGMVDVLRDIRLAMERTEDMLATAGRASGNQRAAALASALVKAEIISRPFTAGPGSPAARPGDIFGPAAGPMLQMLASCLNEQADGGLFGQLTPAEKRRLHNALAEMIVQAGFEVAGKAATRQVRQEIAEMMRGGTSPAALQRDLAGLLAERLATAPPARGNSKQQFFRNVLKWGPKVLGLMESLLGQWDRMDTITVELLQRRGRMAAAVTFAVKPGKQVRLADIFPGMPAVVFEGTCRLVIQPDAAGTGQTVISFQPGKGGGAVELHYEGLIFALARLLAVPLADGPLRELRVTSTAPPEGRQMFNIAVLSEATDDKADPRRMIVLQDTSIKHLVREAFEVKTVSQRRRTVVNYITPDKRYTYDSGEEKAGR